MSALALLLVSFLSLVTAYRLYIQYRRNPAAYRFPAPSAVVSINDLLIVSPVGKIKWNADPKKTISYVYLALLISSGYRRVAAPRNKWLAI